MSLVEFFSDPNARWVLFSVILISGASAAVGVFAFLKKQALVGDAVSHAVLPGICLAFMLTQIKSPWVLLPGAIISGWLGILSVDYLTTRTKLKGDAALSLTLSVFYGTGILLLTAIQKSGQAAQSGLDKFLFGKTAALVREDLSAYLLFALLVAVVLVIGYPWFRVVIFDRIYASAKGLPVKWIERGLSLLMVFSVALGIQAVGVVLMAALLITPAAAARFWTHRLDKMIFLAVLFAILSSILGAWISYARPKMPTGPWIVSALSVIALLSFFIGSKKGMMARWRRIRKNNATILRENILKVLYQLGESGDDFSKAYSLEDILRRRYFSEKRLRQGIRQLRRLGLIHWSEELISLSSEGLKEGRRVVRIHRLWETYLTVHLKLPSDHVHEDADAIEHIITPEIEKELEQYLSHPVSDPHNSPIPYG